MFDSGVYNVENDTICVRLANRCTGDIFLKRGTYSITDSEISCTPDVESRVNAVTLNGQDDCSEVHEHVEDVDYSEYKDQLVDLLCEHRKLALPHERLACTNIMEQVINLEALTKPIYIPAYRMPLS